MSDMEGRIGYGCGKHGYAGDRPCTECAMERAGDHPASPGPVATAFPHYFRPCPFDVVDIYRMLWLFEVTDQPICHAIKKLMAAGQRGAKDAATDVNEAIAALRRWQEMRAEEGSAT